MYKLAPYSSRCQFHELLKDRNLFGIGVEIGVHRGEFTQTMVTQWGCKHFYGIDPWSVPEGYEEQDKLLWGGPSRRFDYQEAIAATDRYPVTLYRMTSKEAIDRNVIPGLVDFVYVDGDHRRDHVLFDLCAWWGKLRPGGILAGHDWMQPGESHRWADEIQQAVTAFVTWMKQSSNLDVDVYLINEEGGLPWSFYLEKP